jgi:hypothetical protein
MFAPVVCMAVQHTVDKITTPNDWRQQNVESNILGNAARPACACNGYSHAALR